MVTSLLSISASSSFIYNTCHFEHSHAPPQNVKITHYFCELPRLVLISVVFTKWRGRGVLISHRFPNKWTILEVAVIFPVAKVVHLNNISANVRSLISMSKFCLTVLLSYRELFFFYNFWQKCDSPSPDPMPVQRLRLPGSLLISGN